MRQPNEGPTSAAIVAVIIVMMILLINAVHTFSLRGIN
jgi:hypothetical protein